MPLERSVVHSPWGSVHGDAEEGLWCFGVSAEWGTSAGFCSFGDLELVQLSSGQRGQCCTGQQVSASHGEAASRFLFAAGQV